MRRLVASGIRNIVVFQTTNYYYLDTLKLKPAMVKMVNDFARSNPNVKIQLFPAFDFIYKYFTHPPPTANRVWNPNGRKSCFDQNTEMPCKDPEHYINYDLYHPTTVPNYNLAIDLAQFINQNWSDRLN